jgi:hypothetical protein
MPIFGEYAIQVEECAGGALLEPIESYKIKLLSHLDRKASGMLYA